MAKAATIARAWEMAHELTGNSVKYDQGRTDNAGYPVYSNESGAWVSDLTTRLEVNTPDGNTVNIWIEPDVITPDRSKYYTEQDAIKVAKILEPVVRELTERVTFAVSGDTCINEDERRLYDKLKEGDTCAASEVVVKWCIRHGIPWGSVRVDRHSLMHVRHGDKGGHFCFDAYITRR